MNKRSTYSSPIVLLSSSKAFADQNRPQCLPSIVTHYGMLFFVHPAKPIIKDVTISDLYLFHAVMHGIK